jgi:hypothetical protein
MLEVLSDEDMMTFGESKKKVTAQQNLWRQELTDSSLIAPPSGDSRAPH